MKTAAGLVLPLAALALAGCEVSWTESDYRGSFSEADVEQYNAQVEPAERLVCRMEAPFGSRIKQQVCRRVRSVEAASALAQREWRRAENNH